MAEQISVGLIGYGMAGRTFHAPVIQSIPDLKLKKVVERRTNEARLRYPWIEVVPDAAALLEDEEIELVVIATPNTSHFDLARQALQANKHVIVEKPFTTTSGQARELIELSRRRHRVISVNHNRRWDGDFRTVEKLLESRLLGRLVEYESHFNRFRNYPRPGAWREEEGTGSGILFDLGSHLIDQAQVLFGLPQMITADIRVQRDFAKTNDSFELILHYDDLKVTLKAGMLVREQSPRFILHGTEGSFVKHGFDPQEEALKRGFSPSDANWGNEPREQWGTLITQVGGLEVEGHVKTRAGCYQSFYRNIVDVISGRAELAVKPEEAMTTIRIIESAMESSEQKRTIHFSL
jgi:predicted dehydrogenase